MKNLQDLEDEMRRGRNDRFQGHAAVGDVNPALRERFAELGAAGPAHAVERQAGAGQLAPRLPRFLLCEHHVRAQMGQLALQLADFLSVSHHIDCL